LPIKIRTPKSKRPEEDEEGKSLKERSPKERKRNEIGEGS